MKKKVAGVCIFCHHHLLLSVAKFIFLPLKQGFFFVSSFKPNYLFCAKICFSIFLLLLFSLYHDE